MKNPVKSRPRHFGRHRYALHRLTILVVLFGLSSQAIGRAAPPDPDPARFLEEYRLAIRELEKQTRTFSVEGEVIIEYALRTDDTKKFIQDITYAAGDRDEVWTTVTKAGLRHPDERKVAVLIQPKRAVVMKQLTPRKGYSIVNLLKNPSDLRGAWSEDKTTYITPALTVGQISLVRPVASGRFQVRSVRRVELRGRPLLRVDFTCPPNAKGGDPVDAIDIAGWMTVDPALGHAICEHDVRLTYPGKSYFDHQSKGKVTYQDHTNGIPLPKEVDISLTEPFAKTYHFVATKASSVPLPPREFTLDAFGLGDFDAIPGQGSNHATAWSFGIGALALALGLFLKDRIRSR